MSTNWSAWRRSSTAIIGGCVEVVETTLTRNPRRCTASTSERKSPSPENSTKEHLHQQRDVAEQFHIGGAEPDQPGIGRGANDADQCSHGERQAPCAKRGCERPAGAEKERLQIGVDPVGRRLKKDAPVPVVVHAALSFPKIISDVVVVQPGQDWDGDNDTGPLDPAAFEGFIDDSHGRIYSASIVSF